jgi:type IV secretory pathway protease TraF
MRRPAGDKPPGARTLKRVAVGALAATALAMLALPMSAGSARLVWNASPSAPAGLYSIDLGKWRVGDRVAIQPSAALTDDLARRGVLSAGKLLIKRVAAGKGDTVCRISENVTVNDATRAIALTAARSGEDLPAWRGCRTLLASEVLLLGETPASYDGRYFGVTSAEEILGRVTLVISF